MARAIRIDRKLDSTAVIDVLTDLFILRGVPGHVRSDNGPEFIAKAVRDWLDAVGAKTAFIEPCSPWENGYCESFNSKLRDGDRIRSPKWRDLLLAGRGSRGDRGMARPLQYSAAPLVPGLSAARAAGHPLAVKAERDLSPVGARLGTSPRHALRLELDHPRGAGQRRVVPASEFSR